MNKNLLILLAGLGWILLFLFLGSGYVFNKFSGTSNNFITNPITWNDHLTVFDGALSCSLTTEELQLRRIELKEVIFNNLIRKSESENGYTYFFEDKPGLFDDLAELVSKELQCCPFLKFDISVLPFKKGLALQVSGGKEVKDFLDDFESTVK